MNRKDRIINVMRVKIRSFLVIEKSDFRWKKKTKLTSYSKTIQSSLQQG